MGHLMPTPDGQAKVKRCVKTGKQFFLKNLGKISNYLQILRDSRNSYPAIK
jgi:hypothetical protein